MNYRTTIILALLFALFIASIGLAVGVYNFLTLFLNPPKAAATQKITCANDTFTCQDGQTVTRIKPSCQFAQCPTTASTTAIIATTSPQTAKVLDWSITGTALGKVLLSQNCPLEKEKNETACEPTDYPAQVAAYGIDGKQVERITTTRDGTFSMNLPVGKYLLRVVQTSSDIKCEDKVVTILRNDSSLVALFCAEAIRE